MRTSKTRRNNGEGTFYYSESTKLYVGQFYDNNGKRMSVTSKDKKKCLTKLKAKLKAVDEGTYVEKNKDTIGKLAQRYVEKQYKSNNVNTNTYITKKMYVDNIQKSAIGNIQIQQITKNDIQDYLDTLTKYSNSYIHKIWVLLKKVFEIAVKDEVIIKNPMNSVDKPKSEQEPQEVLALTLDEQIRFEKYFKESNEPYKNIFLLSLKTGMRCGEVLALKLEDIDYENGIIHVRRTVTRNDLAQPVLGVITKNKKTRDIPMSDEVRAILKEATSQMVINANHLLFTLPDGSIIRPSTINTVFKRICKKLGFNSKYSMHCLRHSFATRCIEAGMSMPVVQKLLGHKDIETTINIYTTIFDRYSNDEFGKLAEYMNAHRA